MSEWPYLSEVVAGVTFLVTFSAAVAVVDLFIDLFASEPTVISPLPDYESIGRWLDGRRKYWSRLP